MKIENEGQAKRARGIVRDFRERLRLVELERASLIGIIRGIERDLMEYQSPGEVEEDSEGDEVDDG